MPSPEATIRTAAASAPGAPRRLRRHRSAIAPLLSVALGIAVLLVWQEISGRWVNELWIGRPSTIGRTLWTWVTDGTLWAQLRPTLTEMLLGFALGSAGGVLVGFVLGYFPWAAAIVGPYLTAVYSLPKVALAPLMILWFGIGSEAKVAFSALLVFFLVFYNTLAGVREVDPDLREACVLMGSSGRQVMRYVIIPHAAAWVFVGVRLALPYALVGAVVGEMFASNQGIGFLLQKSTNEFDTNSAFAVLFIMMILSTSLNALIHWVERRIQRWKPSNRGRNVAVDET